MKAFCINCDKEVDCIIGFRFIKNIKVKDIEISYDEMFALCKECGNEIYVPQINDVNVNARIKAYEKVKAGETI
jgi:hypothetical protein